MSASPQRFAVRCFKAESPQDDYRRVFEANGIDIGFTPVLSIQPVNQEALKESLLSDEFDGLVISSQQAIAAINDVLSNMLQEEYSAAINRLANAVLFSIGTKVVSEANFVAKTNVTSPKASLLVESICSHFITHLKPPKLVYYCSKQRGEGLSAVNLLARNVHLKEVIVYETSVLVPLGLENVSQVDLWWVFFSNATVDAVITSIKSIPEGVKVACIGETCANYLFNQHSIVAHAVSKLPNATSLYESMYPTM
jgi:uroporphyrinogen-III synthase